MQLRLAAAARRGAAAAAGRARPGPEPGARCFAAAAPGGAPSPGAAASRRPRAAPQRQRTPEERLWEVVAYNTQSFNPAKLPSILISVGRLPAKERPEERLRAYLEGARKAVERAGAPIRLLGISGSVTTICSARRLQSAEGIALATLVLSALTAEVQLLRPEALVELAQELLRQRLADAGLWQALAEVALAAGAPGPAPLVALLDAFRRALTLGFRKDAVFVHLSRIVTESAPELKSNQLVAAFSSFSRLGNHINKADQHRVLQVTLDQWLASQDPNWEGTLPAHVVKLAVSLTNITDFLGSTRTLRTEAFVAAASDWALRAAAPEGGVLAAEELVVLLWALKELTPLGLGPHRAPLQAALPRWRRDERLGEYSLLRLVQLSEVLVASRPALGEVDEALVDLVVQALARAVGDSCPPDMLARIVALWDQVGEFWGRAPSLAEAVVARALVHVENSSSDASDLGAMLDTLTTASFSRTEAFKLGRGALRAAISSRHDAGEPGLAAALQRLARPAAAAGPAAGGAAADEEEVEDFPQLSAGPPHALHPMELVERLSTLCRQGAGDEEVSAAAAALLGMLDGMPAGEVVPLLEQLLSGTRSRLARAPQLLDLVERLGDLVVAHSGELSTLQLTSALNWFAVVGLPYHLLFEAVLLEILERHRSQGVSWGQVVGVLEAFAAVRLRIPELAELYGRIRQPRELARLPTMALVRLLSAAARLGLADEARGDVREIMDRVLAETTPQRPLPLDSSALIVQSLLLSGTALPDRQLRHLLAWVSGARMPQLTQQQLAILRQYSLFLLAQPDEHGRGSLLRLPVEVQRFASGLLRHRAPAWAPPTSDTTRRFRREVGHLLTPASGEDGAAGARSEMDLSLGPAGMVDLRIGDSCWLLDGPEAFFRPFTAGLQRTPQEERRAWLLARLLGDSDVRQCVVDFFPPAAAWPQLAGPRRLHWLEWGRAPAAARPGLLGL